MSPLYIKLRYLYSALALVVTCFGIRTKNCQVGEMTVKCFRCLTCNVLLHADQICDGKFDCKDISDEFLCTQKRPRYKSRIQYSLATFLGANPRDEDSAVELAKRMCIPNCPQYATHRDACNHCIPGEIQCARELKEGQVSHTCVSKEELCDGVWKCPNGEDELYCGPNRLPKRTQEDPGAPNNQTIDDVNEQMTTIAKMSIRCDALANRVGRFDSAPTVQFLEGLQNMTGFPTSPDFLGRPGPPDFIRGLPPPRFGSHPAHPGFVTSGWSNRIRPNMAATRWNLPQSRMGLVGVSDFRVGSLTNAMDGDTTFDYGVIDKNAEYSHIHKAMKYFFNITAKYIYDVGEIIPQDVDVVEINSICDGTPDCPNEVDELSCPGMFYCKDKQPLYVDKIKVMDGTKDCEDGSDEKVVFTSRYNLIDNWTLQVLVWIMAFTALIGNLVVICNTTIELIKNNRFATASVLLRNRKYSGQEIEGKPVKKRLSRLPVRNIKSGSSRRFRANSGIGGQRRLVRIWNAVLVLNLATADLLMGVYLMCLAVLSFQYEDQTQDQSQTSGVFDHQWRTSSTCRILGTILLLSSQTSVYTLIALTTLRLHTVLKPFASYHLKFRYLMLAILGTWICSFLSAVIPTFPGLRDSFVSEAWVPFPQFQPPVINRTTADTFIRGIAYVANTTITDDPATMEHMLSWNTMVEFVKKVAPMHSNWHFYGYYSEDSVCMPKLFITINDPFWPHALSTIVVNFLAVIYIVSSYITIYCKSTAKPTTTNGQEGKSHVRLSRKHSTQWNQGSQMTKKLGSEHHSSFKFKLQSEVLNRRKKEASVTVGRRKSGRTQSEMQRRIAMLVITDCACWVPICIMSFISFSGFTIPDTAYAITAIGLLPINSALNPLLYSRVLQALWSRGLSSLRVRVSSAGNSFDSGTPPNGKVAIEKKMSSMSGTTVEESFPSDVSNHSEKHLPLSEATSASTDSYLSEERSFRISIPRSLHSPLESIQEDPGVAESQDIDKQ